MHELLERSFGLVLVVSVWSAAGCAGTELLSWRWHDVPHASEDNPAVRILAIWEPAEGTGLDGLPSRGMAGQIFFFTAGSPLPVKVDGDVRVYLFDDHGPRDEQAKPIHQFDFLGDAWTAHLHNGTLGPSYHVYVPYVGKHSYQVSCGLRVRLNPRSGPAIFSNMVHVTLPGTPRKDESQHAEPRLSNTDERGSRSASPQGATLKRATIPLVSLTQTRETITTETQRETTNRDVAHESAPVAHPLRFRLEPAELISDSAGTARSSSEGHPLSGWTAPKQLAQPRRQTYHRHPLTDQTQETRRADDAAHRHPLSGG